MTSKRVARLRKKTQMWAEEKQAVAQKAVGYVRVSTDEQALKGYGLDAQERAIRAFAESQGYELIEVVQDIGVSGATKPEGRLGFSRIIKLAEEKAFSILLVWKFDRLARNLVYAVTTVSVLQDKYNIALRSVTEPIDTSTLMGQTIFAILAGLAAQERLNIVQRTLAGKKEKAQKGGFVGGPAPLGYRKQEGGLLVVAEEAEIVRRIYALRKQGLKLQEIADILNAENIPTKRGGKWYPCTVRYILDNPKYRGYIEYYFRWDGEQYILREGQHQAILSKAS